MSLFQCGHCGCVENSSFVQFFYGGIENRVKDEELLAKYREQLGLKEDEAFDKYCSVCSPEGTGEWHGKFERKYLEIGMWGTNEEGNLSHKETGATNYMKYVIKSE